MHAMFLLFHNSEAMAPSTMVRGSPGYEPVESTSRAQPLYRRFALSKGGAHMEVLETTPPVHVCTSGHGEQKRHTDK